MFKTYLAVFDANDIQFACTGAVETGPDNNACADQMSRYLAHERTARIEVRDTDDRKRAEAYPSAASRKAALSR